MSHCWPRASTLILFHYFKQKFILRAFWNNRIWHDITTYLSIFIIWCKIERSSISSHCLSYIMTGWLKTNGFSKSVRPWRCHVLSANMDKISIQIRFKPTCISRLRLTVRIQPIDSIPIYFIFYIRNERFGKS